MYAYEWLRDLLLGRGRTNSEQSMARIPRSGDNMVPRTELLPEFPARSGNSALELPAPFVPRDQLSLIDPENLLSNPADQSENALLQDPACPMPGPADWLGPMIHSGPFADLGDAAQPDSFTNPSFDAWYELIAGPRNAMAELESQLYGELNPQPIFLAASPNSETTSGL